MQEYYVTRDDSGQRLDKYLMRILPLAPSSFLYKMLRKKNITLSGKKASGGEKILEGDCVRLFLSDDTIRKFSLDDRVKRDREEEEAIKAWKELTPLLGEKPVLYEDRDILLVRKPSGILSQKASASDLSMNEWLRGYMLEVHPSDSARGSQAAEKGGPVFRPSVCNRLDRNTGGILLCGKTLQGSRTLSEVIRTGKLKKTYTMIVHGCVDRGGEIELELQKDPAANQVRVSAKDGRYARTVYRPLRTGNMVSLVEADLITGRSHQLRVHMASIGHPILFDPRYGDRQRDMAVLKTAAGDASLLRKAGRQNSGEFVTAPVHPGRSGQLLWCSEVVFPDPEECPQMQGFLSNAGTRRFFCPAPSWWDMFAPAQSLGR